MSRTNAFRTSLTCVVLFTVYALCGQIFPSVLTEISSDSVHQGVLLMALFLFYPFSAAFSGAVADRWGKPPVILAGTVLLALPFFAASFSGSFAVVVIATLFFGVGGGVVEAQGTAMLCDVNPGRERMVVSLSQAFFCAGAMAGPLAVAMAYRVFPGLRLQTVFLAISCLCAACLPLYLLIRRIPPHAHAPEGAAGSVYSRDLLIFSVAIFLYALVENGLAGWLAVYGTEVFSLSLAEAPLLLTAYWCCLGVTRLVTAFVRIPLSNRMLILVAQGAVLVLFAAMLSAPGVWLFYAALIPLALIGGVIWPAIVAMTGARFRGASGVAVGIVTGCSAIAAALVQLAVGWLAGSLGLRGALACLFLPLAANIVVVFLWLPREDNAAAEK
jgi:fucose permease